MQISSIWIHFPAGSCWIFLCISISVLNTFSNIVIGIYEFSFSFSYLALWNPSKPWRMTSFVDDNNWIPHDNDDLLLISVVKADVVALFMTQGNKRSIPNWILRRGYPGSRGQRLLSRVNQCRECYF